VAIYSIEIASHSFAMTFMNSIRLNATWYQVRRGETFEKPDISCHPKKEGGLL